MTNETTAAPEIARINGIALSAPGARSPADELRQRACTELLRQAAQQAGLLGADDAPGVDGAISEAAASAIEALLEQNLNVPDPSPEACRRHYAARKNSYRVGEHVRARHILFAVTPGVDVAALGKRAEAVLVDVRGRHKTGADRFAAAAREFSNCPSGAEGGELGWLAKEDCAPEFARELFGRIEIGVLPRIVHSRFGLHVVEVQERAFGKVQPFEAVRESVAQSLRQQSYVTALRQYLSVLAGAAVVEGIDLDAAATPLVQ